MHCHALHALTASWRNGDAGDSVEHEIILKNAATELIEIVEHQTLAHLTGSVKNVTGLVEDLTGPDKTLTGPVNDLTGVQAMGELILARDAYTSLQQLRHIINCVVIQGYSTS